MIVFDRLSGFFLSEGMNEFIRSFEKDMGNCVLWLIMDTGKAKPIRVSITRIMEDGAGQVEGEPGAPISPLIGAHPDKKTQNIPLMDLIAQLNFRRRSTADGKKSDSEK